MTEEQAGKVFVVTGASAGIGRVTAEVLAAQGGHVVLAGRSAERTQPVLDEIRASNPGAKVEFLHLDLSDLESVRAAAAAFLARDLPLHVLVNNAGMAGVRGLTPQGFELTFGTNHLGPFLLTMLLLDRLRRTEGSRIVNVASRAASRAKAIDWDALRRPAVTPGGIGEYAVSKLCNVLFTTELARRLGDGGPRAYSLHPGVVATEIWRELPWGLRHLVKLFMISPEQGARCTLFCATEPGAALENGAYYDDCKVVRPGRAARDPALAAELWRRSVEWTEAPSSS
jgi:NAD(P)-dependent dehydrogenase (short-subunit alcohol dehydrogenase family)